MDALLPMSIWVPIVEGDPVAAAAYLAHYSSERSRERRIERGTLYTMGPGEKLLLSTPCRRAHFGWRRFIDDSGEKGINCAWFHNAGAGLSSTLVAAADAIAFGKWPRQRHYTYVDATAIRCKAVPGKCFRKAGWIDTGRRTQERGLLILERTWP